MTEPVTFADTLAAMPDAELAAEIRSSGVDRVTDALAYELGCLGACRDADDLVQAIAAEWAKRPKVSPEEI